MTDALALAVPPIVEERGLAQLAHVDEQARDYAKASKAVALVVGRAAAAAGLDPAKYAGRSLRAELATAANVPERVIALQTGHKSMTVLRRYIREGSLLRENAAARVGL
ncbi:MAG TPA: hypothetical protein VG370_34350 [Chloroflexota bacterium]|nr:hypothetical protein [Chloroflexota bacterium]